MIKIDSSDFERLKKIAKNYEDFMGKGRSQVFQIDTGNITRGQVLSDQFIQWAITTPLQIRPSRRHQPTPPPKKQAEYLTAIS